MLSSYMCVTTTSVHCGPCFLSVDIRPFLFCSKVLSSKSLVLLGAPLVQLNVLFMDVLMIMFLSGNYEKPELHF